MSRLRGNARKKKSRLTNRTLSAVMEIGRRRENPEVASGADATPEQESALDTVELDILALLRTEPDTATVPAVYNDAGRAFTGAGAFPADRYVFGLMICPACHNEMVYYQRRDLLAGGYGFRCRVCQHEIVASLD